MNKDKTIWVENQDIDEFKTGDIVWCILYGKGRVGHVLDREDYTYPVEVMFDNGDIIWYTSDGKYDEDGKRTLFFSRPEVIAATKRPFISTLVGKHVVVETADGNVNGRVFEETSTHLNLDSGYSFAKALCHAVYEVLPENLLKP